MFHDSASRTVYLPIVFIDRIKIVYRELIGIEDVMEDEDLRLGPNGGLVFCMEHLVENFEWLHEAMDPHDDDYFLIGGSH